jgi:hypothetical protein
MIKPMLKDLYPGRIRFTLFYADLAGADKSLAILSARAVASQAPCEGKELRAKG